MQWTELKSDNSVGDLISLFRTIDCASAIRVFLNINRGARIYITSYCAAKVYNHIKSDKKEIGGLLLGRVWESNQMTTPDAGPIVLIVYSVESKIYQNSAVSLKMDAEIWNSVNNCDIKDLLVVGWYHSHPNLGAFFSGIDRKTQKSFFNHTYSLGWVIDPLRNEDKIFVGEESEEYKQTLMVLKQEFSFKNIFV